MKVNFDKKHPFTAVDLIPEGEEEEYLTEAQTAEFRRAALKVVHLLELALVFTPFALICELVGNLRWLSSAPSAERILAIVGYIGLAAMLVTLFFLFRAGRKLTKLSKTLTQDKNREEDSP